MLGGYVGKILRVNLSNESFKDQPLLDEAALRKYVGCFGLGLRILYDELPPE
ncbi:MAG: aldehyde ferredoxin oxidoreductase N-terminal domain-containing protein [Candidatus Bathyarchaeia archaeon]